MTYQYVVMWLRTSGTEIARLECFDSPEDATATFCKWAREVACGAVVTASGSLEKGTTCTVAIGTADIIHAKRVARSHDAC